MSLRQQLLHLFTAESALDTPVVAWAFHDGCAGRGPGLPEGDPPYPTGLAALQAGWMLLQAPVPAPLVPGAEHDVGGLAYEHVFERRVELPAADPTG